MFGANRDPRLPGYIPIDPPINHYPASPDYEPVEKQNGAIMGNMDISREPLITKHRFVEVSGECEKLKKELEESKMQFKTLKVEADKLYYRKEELKKELVKIQKNNTEKDVRIKELETRIKELESSNLRLSMLPESPAPREQYPPYYMQSIQPPISSYEREYVSGIPKYDVPDYNPLGYNQESERKRYRSDIQSERQSEKQSEKDKTQMCYHTFHTYHDVCAFAHSIADLKICNKPNCNKNYCKIMLHSEEERNILYELAKKCGAPNGDERICRRYFCTGGKKCSGNCKCIHLLYEQPITPALLDPK